MLVIVSGDVLSAQPAKSGLATAADNLVARLIFAHNKLAGRTPLIVQGIFFNQLGEGQSLGTFSGVVVLTALSAQRMVTFRANNPGSRSFSGIHQMSVRAGHQVRRSIGDQLVGFQGDFLKCAVTTEKFNHVIGNLSSATRALQTFFGEEIGIIRGIRNSNVL